MTSRGSGANSISFVHENTSLSFTGNGTTIECTNFNNFNYCYRSYLTPEAVNTNKTAVWKIEKLKNNELILLLNEKNNYKIIFNK